MASDALRILIAGGGTGGHLYPGVAVAREILRRRPEAQIAFAGTVQGIEARVIPREGFPLDVIRSKGIKGKSIGNRLSGAALVPLGLVDASRILSARKPHLVIGVGGYSSGPVVAMAWLRGIPTMLVEQNAVPGLTNRMLAPLVRAAGVTFESTAAFFGDKAFVSGNPVRPEFLEIASSSEVAARERVSEGPPSAGAHILVFGGSQGAHAINVAMAEAAPGLAAIRPALRVAHQTGERDADMVRAAYQGVGLEADVQPFFFDMGRRVAEADVIVCRAGATTIAEITAAGKPAILIPLPTATDDHQRKNAELLASAGAAELLLQQDMTGNELARRIVALAGDRAKRAQVSAAARSLARPDAARVIVDRALELAGRPTC